MKLTIILVFTYIIVSFFVYCIIVGGNINKTDEERRLEDEEQIKYLRNCSNKKK